MFLKAAVLTLLTLGCSELASANVLAPGQSGAPDALNPNGTFLVQTSGVLTVADPSGGPLATVNYTTGVYLDYSSAVCPGCLDFFYILTNQGPNPVDRLSALDFAGATTDVGYNATTSGQVPATVDRSGDGGTVGFNFTGPSLASGASTSILLIETDATTYYQGAFTIASGSDSVTGIGYAPTVATTPEPATLGLFSTGLLGVVGAVRRRFAV